MFLSLRSPKGGAPIRQWLSSEKGEENISLTDDTEPTVTPESFYCLRIGWYGTGEAVFIKDHEAFKLYKLLKKQYDRL